MKKKFLVVWLIGTLIFFANQLFACEKEYTSDVEGIYLSKDGKRKLEIKKIEDEYQFLWGSVEKYNFTYKVINYHKFKTEPYEAGFYSERYFFELKDYGYEMILHIEDGINKNFNNLKPVTKENSPYLSEPIITHKIIKFIKKK